MSPEPQAYRDYWQANRTALLRYLVLFLILTAGVVGYLLIQENYRYLAIAVAPVLVFIAASHPRLAVYQFMVFLFSNAIFSESPVVLWVDLSACVVVCAAVLDFFVEYSPPRGFPRLTLNWILLLAAVFIASVTGYDFFLGLKPMARIILMSATFLSVYRLSRHFELRHIVVVFFWLAVINAIIGLAPVLSATQVDRAFGLGFKTLDDLMMVALPMGTVLYLCSREEMAPLYLLGTGLTFMTLLATQSRLPIMFGLASSVLVMLLALRFARRKRNAAGIETTNLQVRRRIGLVFFFAVGLLLAMAVIRPDMLAAVLLRFEDLIFRTTGGTVALRLVLWKTALQAFWDNPILGIGPGNYDVVHRIYQYLHLDPIQTYVRGLSAHNPVLHYMAETGIVGTSALIALLIRQYRLARIQFKIGRGKSRPEVPFILYILAAMFLVTAFFEAAWMWGQMSFVFVFFLALIVRSHDRTDIAE